MDSFGFSWKVLSEMRRVRDVADRQMQPFCEKNGITSVQLRILAALRQEGRQSLGELSRRTHTADANSSAQCKKLAQKGLVRRVRCRSDERQLMLSLSPAGEELVDELARECETFEKQVSARLTPEDQEIILAGLERLATLLAPEKEKDA